MLKALFQANPSCLKLLKLTSREQETKYFEPE